MSSVDYVKEGDYYDLTVPFWEHYVAHGLVHHNSGKSVSGIIKALERVHRGMSGLMCSPNLPHYKRSLWPEFRRWCPWDRVTKKHQRFGKLDWEPHEPFNIVFKNDAVVHCTGIENPGSLEGPNLNWALFDEARHHPDGKALKVLDGRVRIPGPKGQPPQIFLTTTPALNWLYEYFGPVIAKCPVCGEVRVDTPAGKPWACPDCGRQDIVADDPFAAFKADCRVITLFTEDNEVNLFEGFAASRAQTLTEKEATTKSTCSRALPPRARRR
ncbi:MAG: terminase large subunit domain-containing protein [Planctomycetota bacterium]